MKKATFFVAVIVISKGVCAQSLSKQELLDDLRYLNEAVVNGHPVNYDPATRTDILPVIETAAQIDDESLSPDAYLRWIRKGIYHIGCIHTSISKNPLAEAREPDSFVPLTASISGDELIVTSCLKCDAIGQAIESINGVDSVDLIEPYREYWASDGATDAFSRAFFHYSSSELIASQLQHPKSFTVETAEGDFAVLAVDEPHRPYPSTQSKGVLLSNQSNQLVDVSGTLVLRISEFRRSDRRFFRKVFEEVDELGATGLVVDLRQNTGGDRRAAVELTRHLVDTEFSYSILQPRLSTFRYLNGKGKFYFFLSKLKYNVGSFYRSRKSDLGREFRYKYKPAKRGRFSGRLFVITDGLTASASTMVTSWLKQHSNAIFIGGQAGGGYNGNNGGTFPLVTLPHSRVQIRFPGYRVVLDRDSRMRAGIVPDVSVPANTETKDILALSAIAEAASPP